MEKNRVENFVAKGENAHHKQFLLLPRCFQKSSAQEAAESIYMWERIKASKPHLYNNFDPISFTLSLLEKICSKQLWN